MTKLIISFIYLSTVTLMRFIVVRDNPEKIEEVMRDYKHQFYLHKKAIELEND